MFFENKTAYIFVTLGVKQNKIKKRTFFEKLFKKPNKNNEFTNLGTENDFYRKSETLMSAISKYSYQKCFSFYLYLENTHDYFIKSIIEEKANKYYIFPFFPQTVPQLSLIANFFSKSFENEILNNFFWIKPYHLNPYFIRSIQKNINDIIKKNNLDQKDTLFLFIADEENKTPLFSIECQTTCQKIIKAYQYIDGKFYYYPFNLESLTDLEKNNRQNIIIIPITSIIYDNELRSNIDVLKNFLENKKKRVFYTKSLNESDFFIRSIVDIIEEKNFITNNMLIAQN